MKEYEGPVFQNRQHKQREASKFKQASHRSATRRSFKPAPESRQEPYETAYQGSNRERFDHLKQGQVQRESLTDAPTPSETYDIPFKRQRDESMGFRSSQASTERATDVSIDSTDWSPRSLYEPAFKREARQTEIVPEEVEPFVEEGVASEEETPFQPKQMPKPYRKAQQLAEVDLQTRELAKRLVKSPDSFLLFEEE